MFRNPIVLSIIGITIVSVSVYADWGLNLGIGSSVQARY